MAQSIIQLMLCSPDEILLKNSKLINIINAMSKSCANFMCRAQLLSGTDAYYCCNINRLYCWNCRTSCRCSNQLRSRQVTFCDTCESQDKLVLNYCKKCIDSANTRCIGCINKPRSTKDANIFIGKMDMVRIHELMFKLAPDCGTCGWRKVSMCVEKCCEKNVLFCKECEGNDHMLHKTNSLAMLCIDGGLPDKESFREMAKEELAKLLKLLNKELQRCGKIIKQQTDLATLLTSNIEEIESLIKEYQHSWQKDIDALVKDLLFGKTTLPKARNKFVKTIQKVNFWEDSQTVLKTIPKTLDFLEQFQSNLLRQSEYSYGKNTYQKICNLVKINNNNFLEKTIKQTCFEDFAFTTDSSPEETIMDMPGRARQINVSKINVNSFVSRLFINTDHFGNFELINGLLLKVQLPLLVQLHTPYFFANYPQANLQSLTINTQYYRKKIIDVSTTNFPSSLVVLRIRQSPGAYLPINLTNLTKLKSLVISDSNLSVCAVKSIISSAIKNDYRMLCLLRNPCRRNYSKVGNWQFRLESDDSHIYPQLKRHYIAYRRKMLQVMLLHKTQLRKISGIYRENILETAMAGLELDIQKDFG